MIDFEEYETIIFGKTPFEEKLKKIKNLTKKGEKIQSFKALTSFNLYNLNPEETKILNEEIKKLLNEPEIINHILYNTPCDIFILPEGEAFKEFIDKYHDILKGYFQGRLIYQYSGGFDDLDDEALPFYYKRKFNYWDNQNKLPELSNFNYAIIPIRRDSFNCYYFYKTFREAINICYTNDGHNSIFTSIEFSKLKELFKEEYKYKNYNSYLIFNELLCRAQKNNYQYFGPIDLTIYQEIFKKYKKGDNIANLDFFTKQVLEMIESSSEVSKDFDIISYLSNIKYLRTLPKKERRKSPVYQALFNQYKRYFLNECNNNLSKNTPLSLTEEDNHILELVFERSINQDVILKTLKIDSLKKLYFFFKTNCIDLITHNISLEEIKKFNAKHFFNLKEKMNIPLVENKREEPIDILKISENNSKYQKLTDDEIIKLLSIIDYDCLNTLICQKGIKKEIFTIIKALDLPKMKDKDYKALIYKLIKDLNNRDINLEYKENENPALILRIIDFMIEHNYKKITLDRVLKRINRVSYLLFPNNYQLEDYLGNLDLVVKGNPFFEKIEAISLYDIYRYRVWSSIPEVEGSVDGIYYSLVDMHDEAIICNGIGEYIYPKNVFASSCLTPHGKAASCLKHGATNPNGRFLKITNNGKIIGYSWLWRQGELLCLDNLELTKDYLSIPNNEKIIYDILTNVASSFINQTKNDKNPIKLVILGRNKIDVTNNYIDKLECVSNYHQENFKPQDSKDLYLKDSQDKQVILAGTIDNINLEDIEPIYKYQRKPVVKFNSLNKNELEDKINSIYFDYCLKENIKYFHKEISYIDGYLGEDWFLGINEDGTEELYTRRNNQDIIEEIKNITHKDYKLNVNIFVPKTEEKDKLVYLLNYENYLINEQEIKEYLEYISALQSQKPISDYFHSPQNEKYLLSILVDHAITSNHLGRRNNDGRSNGTHFICLAKIPSRLYDYYSGFPGFGFKDNLCTFRTDNGNSYFNSTTYPLHYSGHSDEYQVKDFLSLDKANALIVPCDNYKLVSILPTLQEYTTNNLPIYSNNNFQKLDEDIIKKYAKLK